MTQWTPNHDNHPDCVICKLPILPTQDDPYSQGFDAEPIAAGRCCDVCNKQVIASVKGAEKKAYLGSDPRFNKAWLEIGDYDEGERFNKNFLAALDKVGTITRAEKNKIAVRELMNLQDTEEKKAVPA